MPVFEQNPDASSTLYGNIFTVDNWKIWIPVVIGILIVLYLLYRYYFSGSGKATLKRY